MNPPIWKSENDAGCCVFHNASVAAIFIGCTFVVSIPNALPHQSWIAVSGIKQQDRSFAAARKTSTFRPRRRCQAETPSTTKPPVRQPARMTCTYAKIANFWNMIVAMSVAWAVPVDLLIW